MKTIKKIASWFSGFFLSSNKESWRVVLLCLLAGTTFWVLNALNKNYTTKINYPINFIIADTDSIVIVEELPEKVEIDVSGGGWNLLRKTYWFNINPLDIPLNNPTQVDYILGGSLVPFISDQLSEVSLNYVVTDTLHINIQEKISKTLTVTIDSSRIPLKSPYQVVSKIIIEPDSVVFTGPKSLINKLPDSIYIKIQHDVESNFNEDVQINYSTSELVEFSPQNVNVQFNVAAFARHTKVVDVLPVNFPEDSSAVLIDDKVEVIYSVQEEYANNIKEEDFQIMANFRNLAAEDSTINATLGSSPEIISDLRVNPKKLRVRLSNP